MLPSPIHASVTTPRGSAPRRAWLRYALAVTVCSLPVRARAIAQGIPVGDAPPIPVPAWAFPTTSSSFHGPVPPFDSVTRLHVPHSAGAFPLAKVMNHFGIVDWRPDTHPRPPAIVTSGRPGAVWACGYCHQPDGQGRTENAVLAGLPADYIVRQIEAMRARSRASAVVDWPFALNMRHIADSVTDDEAMTAARYFAALRPVRRYRVVERAQIPGTHAIGGLYAVRPGDPAEPLGRRVIEVAEDAGRHELRDPAETFVAWVPPGSIAAGRRIAHTLGSVPVRACVSCHGPALRGVGLVPGIAGRSPSYLLRQLLAFHNGTRATPASVPMQLAASTLTLDDMIAVVAYAGSLRP